MNTQKEGKAWYKKWWVWLIIIVVVFGIGGASSGSKDTPSSTTPNGQAAQEAPKVEEKPKWDVEAEYAKITDGMTKAEVEAAISKKSDNCTESASEYLGKSEMCTYGGFGDNGVITVHFSDDKVSTKSKSKF